MLQVMCLTLQGVCKHDSGLTLFVDALPGEVLTARVDKVKKGAPGLVAALTTLLPPAKQ